MKQLSPTCRVEYSILRKKRYKKKQSVFTLNNCLTFNRTYSHLTQLLIFSGHNQNLGDTLLAKKDRSAPVLSSLKLSVPKKPLERNLIIGASGQVGGALVEALGTLNCIGT